MKRRQFITTSISAVGASILGRNAVQASEFTARPSGKSVKLDDLLTLDDFEQRARELMPRGAYNYVSGGAADMITVRLNREMYQELRLNHRVLVDVSRLDCSVTLFGRNHSVPFLLAPTASHKLAHPEGESATARGASAAGVGLILSSNSNTSIEEVVSATSQPVWFQLYMPKEREATLALIRRIEAAGAQALCVTVDNPVAGTRNLQEREKVVYPSNVGFPHLASAGDPAAIATLEQVRPQRLDWSDIAWMRERTKLPLLLKGIMNPLDAECAIQHGVDGIIVSNHGGRELDTQPATIQTLPGVARQVRGRIPVLVDGGIRRGTDVVKALALGASAVLIGRPYVYGLAVGGDAGVERVCKILRRELLQAMALLGRTTVASLDASIIWKKENHE